MSDRRENSVLFSLKELRRIEDDRVRQEQDELAARREAERAAKEAADRAAREAEDKRQRDEAERIRRAEEEAAARTREDQMRLQEAERRARVEGEMRIHEERMRLEVQTKAKNSPVKAVVSVAVVIIAVAGGLGYKMYTQHEAEMAAQRAELARVEAAKAKVEAEKAAAEAEYKSQMTAIQKEMNDRLATAKNDEERAKIRAEAVQRAQAARTKHSSSSSSGKAETPATAPGIHRPGKRDISDSPLDGLGL